MQKKWLLAMALCALVSISAAERAVVGQPLPPINAVDENNAVVPLNQFKDKMGVVVFFFPKAFTGGCVCENAGFRDHLAEYTAKGYVILGASRDDPIVLQKFKEVYHLNYTLLSDPRDELANALGLDGSKRDTAVIAKDGRLLKQYHDVIPQKHFKELLAELP